MILAEIWYRTCNQKFLAIVEAFKTRRNYLEVCKYEIFVFNNYNNLYQFINVKSLSPRQVLEAQKLSFYHFQIDYCQDKAHGATNALSYFL